MNELKIVTPLDKNTIKSLNVGDEVLLSGVIFTARDAAHRKFHELIKKGKRIPLNLKDAVIYYCGPTPPMPRRAIVRAAPPQVRAWTSLRRTFSGLASAV